MTKLLSTALNSCPGKLMTGYMEYSFQDGTNITLVNFLDELQKQSSRFHHTILPCDWSLAMPGNQSMIYFISLFVMVNIFF